MKVRMLRSLGSNWSVQLVEGEEASVNPELGRQLVAEALAVVVEEVKPQRAEPRRHKSSGKKKE